MTPQQLKKALISTGLEVFRTTPEDVVLAERVRENLILDSGVRIRPSPSWQVRIVMRAQRVDFPKGSDAELFERVRALGEPAVEAGFQAVAEQVTPVKDPADADKTLDTFFEIVFARDVEGLEQALEVVKFALRLEKIVSAG